MWTPPGAARADVPHLRAGSGAKTVPGTTLGPRRVSTRHACYSDIPPLYYGARPGRRRRPVHRPAARPAGRVPGADRAGDVAVGQAGPVADDARQAHELVSSTSTRSASRWPPRWPWRRPPCSPGGARGTPRCSPSRRRWRWPARSTGTCTPSRCSRSAMLAWARETPVAAGVLIGLAAATKFYPLFLLGPLLVLCLRAGRMREYCVPLGGRSCLGVVNVPFMLADFDGWSTFYRLSRARRRLRLDLVRAEPAGPRGAGRPRSTWWPVGCSRWPVRHRGAGAGGARRPRLAAARVPRRRRVPADEQGVLAAVRLWLLPLAVLARPRWRDFLIWQAGRGRCTTSAPGCCSRATRRAGRTRPER